MINVKNMFNHSKTVSPISSTDTTIKISSNTGRYFVVPNDDHFYVTVRQGTIFEHMKVVGVTGDSIIVVRGQDNTVGQSFSTNACIDVMWNPLQLCEYVKVCANGTEYGGMTGTYCMSCDTCFTVDNGRIVDVNGSQKC